MKLEVTDEAPVIRPNFSACQLDTRERKYTDCKHHSILVDEHSVECAACKKTLNANAVLLDFASRERRLRGWEGEHKRLMHEIEQLKAERTKLKAAVRRAAKGA